MLSTDASIHEHQTVQAVLSSLPEQPVTPRVYRPRHWRRTETLRRLLRENTLRVEDVI